MSTNTAENVPSIEFKKLSLTKELIDKLAAIANEDGYVKLTDASNKLLNKKQ